MPLEPLERVDEQEGTDAEGQQGRGVLRPALFLIFTDAAQLVDERLDRPHNRMQERPLALEQPRHEEPDRLGDEQDQAEEHDDLQQADASHRRPQNFSGLNIAHPR
jgi:hypothetical protein